MNVFCTYSLERICDELSYDPATGAGESVDQSVGHVVAGYLDKLINFV